MYLTSNYNTSATGGYLLPDLEATVVLDDKALDRFLHDLFVGLTGLDNKLVRPRWSATPETLVPNGDILLTQGVLRKRDDVVAHQYYKPDVGMIIIRNQELDVLCSFYGEYSDTYEGIVRDGLSIDQNREYINSQGIVLVAVGNPRKNAELINNHWVKRTDVEITFRRLITRVYPVLHLLAADIDLHIDAQDHEIVSHIRVDRT